MEKKRHYYIYKITDSRTSEYYIGKRISKKEPQNDIYWGSGKNRICRSARKHKGKDFIKEILEVASNHEKLCSLEESYVTIKLIESDTLCLNLQTGGKCLINFSKESRKKMSERAKMRKHSEETKRKISSGNKGKVVTEEARKKMSESKKGNRYNFGKKITEETRKKISEASRNRSEESRKKNSISKLGQKHSAETRKKMSEAQKLRCAKIKIETNNQEKE